MRRLTFGFAMLLSALLTVPAGAALRPATAVSARPTDAQIVHVLNRLGYGPRPGDIAMVREMGLSRYIAEQLHPDRIADEPRLTADLNNLPTLHMTSLSLLQSYAPEPPPGGDAPADVEARKQARMDARKRAREVVDQLLQARLERALFSRRQLQEVMTEFWFNHFNVYVEKGQDRVLIAAYEEQAIRPFVLGHFRDLLGATAHSPAMSVYLDNWQNTDPGQANSKRPNARGLNENYARELMELHTLGVDGGYTQNDVISLAKILTGWSFCRLYTPCDNDFGFRFEPRRHNNDPKTFLGQTLQPEGELEGEHALDMLAKSPVTARHLSIQLATYFLGDNPPQNVVDAMTRRYLKTNGSIADVLDTLFRDPAFWMPQTQKQFKTPYQYVLSAVRATGLPVTNVQPMENQLRQQGMLPYVYLTPDGYNYATATWLNPDAMVRRVSFATALGSGRMPLTKDALPVTAATIQDALGPVWSAKTLGAVQSAPDALKAGLLLGSPEMMYR